MHVSFFAPRNARFSKMRPQDYRICSTVYLELLLGLGRFQTCSKTIIHRNKCMFPSLLLEMLVFRKCDHKITVFVQWRIWSFSLAWDVRTDELRGEKIERSAWYLLFSSKCSFFENATTRLPYLFNGVSGASPWPGTLSNML